MNLITLGLGEPEIIEKEIIKEVIKEVVVEVPIETKVEVPIKRIVYIAKDPQVQYPGISIYNNAISVQSEIFYKKIKIKKQCEGTDLYTVPLSCKNKQESKYKREKKASTGFYY